MVEKAALRREMTARRDAMPDTERARIAEALSAILVGLPEWAAAKSVLATMSIGSEWSTRPLLERAHREGKAIILPRLTTPPRQLELRRVNDLDRHLVPGIWDIPEPDPDRCARADLADVDFAVVPALAADREGYRLGYGAGYFDRLLTRRGPRPFCVTAISAAFLVDAVPHEAHDVRVDLVVCENGPVMARRSVS